jgi:hypothetical protein
VLDRPVTERIALALSLGDDDLAVFMRATGLERSAALRQLRARRHHGRIPSASASGQRP